MNLNLLKLLSFEKLNSSKVNQVINVGGGKGHSVYEIIKYVKKITNMEFKIDRNGELLSIPVSIGSQMNSDKTIGVLGVSFGTSRTLAQSLSKGMYETYNLSLKTLQFIGKMLSGNMGTENLSGPIGIAQMAGNTAQAGLLPFMYLMALLSISLAVLNLLTLKGILAPDSLFLSAEIFNKQRDRSSCGAFFSS